MKEYVIYRFIDLRDNSVAYIGSTLDMTRRLEEYKDEKFKRNSKFAGIYRTDINRYELEILGSFAFLDSVERRKREQWGIDTNKPKHNIRSAYFDRKAYYQRPERKAYAKAYYQRPERKAYFQRPEVKEQQKICKQKPERKAYDRKRYEQKKKGNDKNVNNLHKL